MQDATITQIANILINIGAALTIDEINENSVIGDYIEDSVMFITFIVELEKAFSIEFPDEYLLLEELEYIGDVSQIISYLKKASE